MCEQEKKSQRLFPHAHTHTHTHLRGRCCIRALQNAHTESVPHLHWFKLPSGPIWRIWPPGTHTNTQHLWNSQPTCSCMHAKTNMHAHTNHLAKQHSSVTDIISVGSIGLAYVEVCHIPLMYMWIRTSWKAAQITPRTNRTSVQSSSTFPNVAVGQQAHAYTCRQWIGQRERAGKERLLIKEIFDKASAGTVRY